MYLSTVNSAQPFFLLTRISLARKTAQNLQDTGKTTWPIARTVKPPEPPVQTLASYLGSAEPGMFKGELLVHFTGLNPDHVDETIQVQMLVDQSDVKGLHGQPK